jgi:hypothetical protein
VGLVLLPAGIASAEALGLPWGYVVQYARPDSDILITWTPSVGVTLYGCIDEETADDADYIKSAV